MRLKITRFVCIMSLFDRFLDKKCFFMDSKQSIKQIKSLGRNYNEFALFLLLYREREFTLK